MPNRGGLFELKMSCSHTTTHKHCRSRSQTEPTPVVGGRLRYRVGNRSLKAFIVADCCVCFSRYILNAHGCLFGSEQKQRSQCITFPAASSYIIIDRQGLLPRFQTFLMVGCSVM